MHMDRIDSMIMPLRKVTCKAHSSYLSSLIAFTTVSLPVAVDILPVNCNINSSKEGLVFSCAG